MTPLKQRNFMLDDEAMDALKRIKDRDGIPVSEQLRRAVAAWIESKEGSKPKSKSKK